MRLTGKCCIVTGGGSGIGRAISLGFVREGAAVVVADREGAKAEEVALEAGANRGSAVPVKADVTRTDDVDRMVDLSLREFGRVDVLINNAGIGKLGSVTELSEQEWDEVLGINLKGPFLCSRRVIPQMLQMGSGSIVNVASVTGIVASPGRAAYCASKAGLVMLTKAMALDYAAQGIRVNAICPGVIVTPMTESSLENPSIRKEKLDKTPMGKLGIPSDIVPAAIYLASEDSGFMTGHALVVDGGWSID
jgi:NAD(P)-dependent dehydrogenase (short-subunit alcohol dehydrogenase family)